MNQCVLHIIYASFSGTALGNAYFGHGTGSIVMDNVHCTGTESTLTSCTHTTDHDCVHSEDAGVRCTSNSKYISNFCYFTWYIAVIVENLFLIITSLLLGISCYSTLYASLFCMYDISCKNAFYFYSIITTLHCLSI